MTFTHLGQYWSSRHGEVRVFAARDLRFDQTRGFDATLFDITDSLPFEPLRRRFRAAIRDDWATARWSYQSLPFPMVELFEMLHREGRHPLDWALDHASGRAKSRSDPGEAGRRSLAELDVDPDPSVDHLVAPIIPRRALAFGVTYLNSALEREVEGQRSDYSYVYKSVKERGERPELFLKGTSPEHFVGPRGNMALRGDMTNSRTIDGKAVERQSVSCGIEPELAVIVSPGGEIWGYTLADDVSGNRIENETLLYLTQAKYFTGSLVLGPLIWLSREQDNPELDIHTRIFSAEGESMFDRVSNSGRINAPLADLVAWAGSHIELTPGEVISTGTDVVPDGRVKVLEPGMRVEISSPAIGRLTHGAAELKPGVDLNLNYSQLEFSGG